MIVGENGAGKSTILDAVCFGLFGKPFRKINKPQLVNSINRKGMLIELEFKIGNRHYLIRRGQKPSIFEIMQDGIFHLFLLKKEPVFKNKNTGSL